MLILILMTNMNTFTIIISEEENYQELKESIRIIKWKESYWKNNVIEEGKRKGTGEIIGQIV